MQYIHFHAYICCQNAEVTETLRESILLCTYHMHACECLLVCSCVSVTHNIAHTCENMSSGLWTCIQMQPLWWKGQTEQMGNLYSCLGRGAYIYITFMWHFAYIYHKWGQETWKKSLHHRGSCQLPGFFRPHRGSPLSYSHLSDRCSTAGLQWHKWVVQPANQQWVIGRWKKQ